MNVNMNLCYFVTTICFSWNIILIQTSVKCTLSSQNAQNHFFFFFLFLGFTFRGMKLWLVWIKSLKVRRCIVSQWSGRRPELLKWRKMQMSNGWTERPFFIICTLLLTRDVCQSVGLHAECLGWQVHSPLQIFRTIFIWLQFTLFSFHRTTKSLSVSGRVCFTFCVKYL